MPDEDRRVQEIRDQVREVLDSDPMYSTTASKQWAYQVDFLLNLLDRLEGEREPVAYLTEAKVGDGEWYAASFWLVEDEARYQVERFNENEGTEGCLVPLYRLRTAQGEADE